LNQHVADPSLAHYTIGYWPYDDVVKGLHLQKIRLCGKKVQSAAKSTLSLLKKAAIKL
jgi:hypothetical protein